MTSIAVHVVGGIPLVRLSGPVTANSGAQLAAEIMASIFFTSDYAASAEGAPLRHLSLKAPPF